MSILRKTLHRDDLAPRVGNGCPVLDAASDALDTGAEDSGSVTLSSHRRVLFNVLGLVSVGVGAVGVFVPGLPTTVFLLIASYFFSRSSPRLKNWLWTRPVLGESLRRISRGERAPFRTRLVSLTSMWIMITATAALGFQRGVSPWILGALVLGGTIGTYYLTLWTPRGSRERRLRN